MMLFALMLKVDVGWGQGGPPQICPNNLLQNPDFAFSGVDDGSDAFCNGFVNNWRGLDFTPHIIQIEPLGNTFCDVVISDNTNTMACLRSGPADQIAITESIAQQGLIFSPDPLVTYFIDISARLLDCGRLNSFTNLDVYLLNSNEFPQGCANPSGGWTPVVSQQIVNSQVNWYNSQNVFENFTIADPTFNAIYIRSWKPYPPTEINQTVLGLDNVVLACQTTALTDLIINNTSGLSYTFGSVNASTVSTFTNYLWTFTKKCTNDVVYQSTNSNTSFTFPDGGEYTICLDIRDNFGCCATRCENLNVPCSAPTSVFTSAVSCVNNENIVTFTQPSSGSCLSYLWNFGDNSTSTTQNPIHEYVNNGTYTITLTVTDACGQSASSTQSVVVNCRPSSQSCERGGSLVGVTLDGGTHGITLSQAFTNLNIVFFPDVVNVYSNMNFIVSGNVTFDISTEFLGCNFIALEGAQIILNATITPPQPNNKGISTFYNCDFMGCNRMWRGIQTLGHTANFFGGSIRDAVYGIHVDNDGQLTARGVTFSNNFVGMFFTSTPSHLIVGNHFTGGGLLPGYTGIPIFADENLCGIYSEVTYSPDFLSSSGNYSLNVGKLNDIRNIFDNMNNGIICNGTFNVNIKNNSFLNFPIDGPFVAANFDQNTPVTGNGVMITGGGIYGGVFFEDNRFEHGTHGILARGIPSVLSVKNNNKFINLNHGIQGYGNGFFFPLNLIVENNNEFECRNKGIFSNSNTGHYFSLKNNTFRLTGIVDQNNPAGFHGFGLVPGFFGRSGEGTIKDNDFLIGAVNEHSNGGVQVTNYRSVDMSNQNVFHFLTPSPIVQSGHSGYLFDNLSQSTVRDNEFYNFSGMPRSGVNSMNSSVNNAICCNKTYGLNIGLAMRNSDTNQSTFKQNEMFDNSIGLQLALNCAIGDQLDHGNIWTGVSRVASYTSINTGNNRFFAEDDQNNNQRSLWPVQLPSVWFVDSDKKAVEDCDNICTLPMSNVTEGDPPSALNIQTLENMLNHDHIVVADHITPSVWSKERWIYGYLTKYPQFLEYSNTLSEFYASAGQDVVAYEDFYKELVDVLTPNEQVIDDMNELKEEAQALLATHELKWDLYQDEPSSQLRDEMDAIRLTLEGMMSNTVNYEAQHRNQLLADLEILKAEISNLPNDKPYTMAAQQYSNVLLDKMIYGDTYVVENHLTTLQDLALLCEPLYKETVVLSRNMLAGLGFETYYDDASCNQVVEPRAFKHGGNESISLMPNPTTGKVSLLNVGDVLSVSVTNSQGTIVKQISGNVYTIDLSELQSGVYFITVLTADNTSEVKKVIKIQ